MRILINYLTIYLFLPHLNPHGYSSSLRQCRYFYRYRQVIINPVPTSNVRSIFFKVIATRLWVHVSKGLRPCNLFEYFSQIIVYAFHCSAIVFRSRLSTISPILKFIFKAANKEWKLMIVNYYWVGWYVGTIGTRTIRYTMQSTALRLWTIRIIKKLGEFQKVQLYEIGRLHWENQMKPYITVPLL